MRGRFKTTRVCSSDNYTLSKKLHMSMLEENHEVFMKMVTKKEIVIKKQAYVKVFGNLMAITSSEVARFEKEITIIWK